MSIVETLIAVGALLIFWVLTVAHVRFWTRRLRSSLAYDEAIEIATPDDVKIELRHLRPAVPSSPVPVLLVHGLGANHRNHDATTGASLARYLQGAGRDVWLLTLRSGVRDELLNFSRVGFAEMVEHDLPTAVAEVLRRTEQPKLDYVGFSMGGMLLYGALGRSLLEEQLRCAVTIGSPGQIIFPRLLRWVRWVPGFAVPRIPLRFTSRALAFASEWVPATRAHLAVVNPRNVAAGATRAALVNIIRDIPPRLVKDFHRFGSAKDGTLVVSARPILADLEKVRTPVLFLSGSADQLAPPRAVRAAFEAWGGPGFDGKELREIGRATGAQHDYAHGDLAIGQDAEREVFVWVREFLARTF